MTILLAVLVLAVLAALLVHRARSADTDRTRWPVGGAAGDRDAIRAACDLAAIRAHAPSL